jgi:succinoglycan biosynthesis transport protein ExoP
MLNKITKSPTIVGPDQIPANELYSSFLVFVRRQWPAVLFVAALCVVLGIVYVINAPTNYTAQATLIIDTHKVNILSQQSVIGDVPVDSATVESQVEILRSENIALKVIKDLRLTEDSEFVGSGGGLVGNLVGLVADWIGGDGQLSEYDLQRRAAANFAKALTIKRVSLTYIIEISFRAQSPQRAAQIANAVADAYIVDQLDAKYKANQRAAIWLQDRLRELRDQLSASERAVVDFKKKNNIVNSGGRLMNEQQLSELNSQLVVAQAQTAESKARLDRIEKIINTEVPDATVTDTLRSEVVTKLRQQYLELKARESDWSTRYGKDHLAAVHLRNQMFQIRRSILDELGRLAETYKSDFAIAQQRENGLRAGLGQAVTESQATNQAEITLRELESTSASYKRLYDNFLQRYMESVQQQTFPITEARVITVATPPLTKSHPKTTLILFLCGAVGLVLGLGTGKLRELSDRVFRTSEQVEGVLQTNCIGIIPTIAGEGRPAPKPAKTDPIRDGERVIRRSSDVYWHVIDGPFTRFAESIRSIKVAADVAGAGKASKSIGLTSALPNEGKSTIAAALALVVAQGGSRVLLVDADLRNPSLTRRLAPQATTGLLEVLGGTVSLNDAVWKDRNSGFTFLPAVLKGRMAHTHEILGAESTKAFFQKLRAHFDYVIVDLSPLAPVVDVRSATSLIDSFVFVVEWGRTKIDVVEHTLRDAPGVYENLLGVALNKADLDVLSRYDSYRGNYYYNKYYARYGYTD